MQKTTNKQAKTIHLGLVMLMVGFFLLDSIMMFFIEPSIMYVLLAMPVLIGIALILYKVKRELMFKEINRFKGILYIMAAMIVNTVIDVIRVMNL